MRRILLVLALAALAATPAFAAVGSYTGSLYFTNFADHHVYRLDVAGGVAGGTTDLTPNPAPGADGIAFDPGNSNRLLYGGQLTNNVFAVGVTGGAINTINNAPIPNGALHLTTYQPILNRAVQGNVFENSVLASGYEGPVPNSLSIVGITSGNVDTHIISGMSMVSGLAFSGNTLFATNGPEYGTGGSLYTVDLATNTGTAFAVQGSHDIHGIWMDKSVGQSYSGHLFATGAQHVEEIDLAAHAVVRSWDLSSLMPANPPVNWIDNLTTDSNGNLFAAANSGEMIYINLNIAGNVGNFQTLKNVGYGLDDVVTGPTPVAEPSTLVLAGLGLLGVGMLRKKLF